MTESIRTYRPGDEETIANLLRKCFGTYNSYGLDSSKWLELAKLNEGFKLEGAYLLEIDGKPISHVQVVEKRLRTSAGILKTAGIANVSTDPEYRGKGYASRLLSYVMEDYKQKGFPLTALFTGYASSPQRIYRRLGYVDICLDSWWIAPIWDAQENMREVRWIEVREAEERDVEHVRKVYETSGSLYTGWPIRSESEYREKMFARTAYHSFFYLPRSPRNFAVAEEGDEVIGYAVAAKVPWDPEGFGIAELIALPGRTDALQALYTYIVKRASEEGARYIRAPKIPGADYARLFSRFRAQGGGGVFMCEIL
ncbi:MAG: GNAT family N-acetyltransferase, partial [Thermofilaceae archaeon]